MFKQLFPELKTGSWAKVNLDEEARLYSTGKENKLLDPKECTKFGKEVAKKHKVDFTWGGYLEDRSHLWRGHYHGPEQFIHLGVDFNVPAGTKVLSPVAGNIRDWWLDGDMAGGWGGRLVIEPYNKTFLVVIAHMAHKWKPKNDIIDVGDNIGTIGKPTENGNWAPHLHIQCVNIDFLANSGITPSIVKIYRRAFDGYAASYDRIEVDFPDPFKALRLK
jgi:hypothetical protein